MLSCYLLFTIPPARGKSKNLSDFHVPNSIKDILCVDKLPLFNRPEDAGLARPVGENHNRKKLKDVYHASGSSDLADMTGLLSILDDDTEYEIAGTVPV